MDLGGRGGGSWLEGISGDDGVGIPLGLPLEDRPDKALTVPGLKPKWVICCCVARKCPGDPSCGLLFDEVIESPDILLGGLGDPGGTVPEGPTTSEKRFNNHNHH